MANTAINLTGASIADTDLGISSASRYTGTGTIAVGGTEHLGDAPAADAETDLAAEYNGLAAQICDHDITGQDLGTLALPLTPGVYCFSSTAQLTGALTLDATGDPNRAVHLQDRNGSHDRSQLHRHRRGRIRLQRLLADR